MSMEVEVALLKELGLTLKDYEARAIVARYQKKDPKTGANSFDKERFVKDVRAGVFLIGHSRAAFLKDLHRPDTVSTKDGEGGFDKILVVIRNGIKARSYSMRGEDLARHSFLLLSENRSPFLTRSQLKAACLYRLNVALMDEQVDVIFSRLDPNHTGAIKTKALVSAVIKEHGPEFGVSLDIPPEVRRVRDNDYHPWVKNQDAHVSYDHKFKGLVAPTQDNALKVSSVEEIEQMIRDKIAERSHLGFNMIQSLVRYFSDGRDKTDKNDGISRDQIRFTLWKTFQMMVSNEDIEKLYRKYDRRGTGFIPMSVFIEGIIKAHSLNEPLLEDNTSVTKNRMLASEFDPAHFHDGHLEDFLKYLRRRFRELINRESRAPHYLFQSTSRMTKEQTRKFLLDKLNARISDALLDHLTVVYDSRGLVDVRRMLGDAMSREDEGILGRDQNLMNGCTVTVDQRPKSLRGIEMKPKDIENMFVDKIQERLHNDHPLSHLHKIFRSVGDGHTRLVNRMGMRAALTKFDIFPNDEEFEKFYLAHARSDGYVEVRPFLLHLLPADEHEKNPFTPKDDTEFTTESHLAKVLSTMTSTRRRQVSCLIGPGNTRFQDKESELLVDKPEAKPPKDTRISEERRREMMNTRLALETLPKNEHFSDNVTFVDELKSMGGKFAESLSAHVPPSQRSAGYYPPMDTARSSVAVQSELVYGGNYDDHGDYDGGTLSNDLSEKMKLTWAPEDTIQSSTPATSPRAPQPPPNRLGGAPPSHAATGPAPAPPSKQKGTVGTPARRGARVVNANANAPLVPSSAPPKVHYAPETDAHSEPTHFENFHHNEHYDAIAGALSARSAGVTNFSFGDSLPPMHDDDFNPYDTFPDTARSAPPGAVGGANYNSSGFQGKKLVSSGRPGSTAGGAGGSAGGKDTQRKKGIPHFKKWKVVDPYNRLLMQKYKVAKKNTQTNHEEYGVFTKNLDRLVKSQIMMKAKLQATANMHA